MSKQCNFAATEAQDTLEDKEKKGFFNPGVGKEWDRQTETAFMLFSSLFLDF